MLSGHKEIVMLMKKYRILTREIKGLVLMHQIAVQSDQSSPLLVVQPSSVSGTLSSVDRDTLALNHDESRIDTIDFSN